MRQFLRDLRKDIVYSIRAGATVPIGAQERWSVQFSAFGNARLVGNFDLKFFSMFRFYARYLRLIYWLIRCAGEENLLILGSYDGSDPR